MLWRSNDPKFAEIFKKHIALSVQAAGELKALFKDGSFKEMRLERISELEGQADALVKECHEVLDRSFITKLDKPDIVLLIHELDEILDYTKSMVWRLKIYRVAQFRPECQIFADIVAQMTEALNESLQDLYHLKHKQTRELVVKLKDLEEKSDHLLYAALEKIFHECRDAKEYIAWKDIFQQLENVTDHCEDVANILSSISRKEGV